MQKKNLKVKIKLLGGKKALHRSEPAVGTDKVQCAAVSRSLLYQNIQVLLDNDG